MDKQPHVCWIDIPADNVERSKKFYSELFGWDIQKDHKAVEGSSPYFMIANPNKTEENHPHFLGGLIKRQNPNHSITVYINVSSVDDYIEEVKKLGGKAIGKKTAVPGWGYFALCQDTENNAFALWEQNKEAK